MLIVSCDVQGKSALRTLLEREICRADGDSVAVLKDFLLDLPGVHEHAILAIRIDNPSAVAVTQNNCMAPADARRLDLNIIMSSSTDG